MLLDLSKALDCIPHQLFISKLKAYGLSNSACKLLMSYFQDRRQRVKLGKCRSDWIKIQKGSAQGSIIGPLSYNIFTSDMFMMR